MTRVRLSEDAPRRVNAGGTLFKQGEPRDLDDERAKQLVANNDYFVLAEDELVDEEADAVEPIDAPEGSGSTADDFDLEAFLDDDYQDRADAVEAGEVDDHLDALAEEETSQTVLDAIEARREALAGDENDEE